MPFRARAAIFGTVDHPLFFGRTRPETVSKPVFFRIQFYTKKKRMKKNEFEYVFWHLFEHLGPFNRDNKLTFEKNFFGGLSSVNEPPKKFFSKVELLPNPSLKVDTSP